MVAAPAAALAHGAAPAALEVSSLRDARPHVVRLNFGLAVRIASDSEHFRYVCPRQWEEYNYVPSVGVLAEGGLVISRFEGPWIGDAQGCGFHALEAPAWEGQTFIAQAGRDPLFLVTRDANGSTVWRVTAGPVLAVDATLPDVKLDSIWPTERGWRALGARPQPIVFTHDPHGTSEQPLDLPEPPQFLGLRAVDAQDTDHFFFAANVEAGIQLFETRDAGATVALVLEAAERLHGPVALDDGLAAVVDGTWHHRAAGAGAFSRGGASDFTCLHAVEGAVFACLDRNLVTLSGPAAAPRSAPAFSLRDLRAPEPACPGEPETARACAEQWLHFAGEAGLSGTGDDDAGPGATDAGRDAGVVGPSKSGGDGGCGTRPGPARGPLPALLGALFWPLRRRFVRALSMPSRIL